MDHVINIGDNTFTIRMRLGVLEHLKTITGRDGLDFISNRGGDIVFGMYALLIAGMMCYKDKYSDAIIPDNDYVLGIIKSDAGIDDLTNILSIYANFINSGEAKAQETVSQSPGLNVKN